MADKNHTGTNYGKPYPSETLCLAFEIFAMCFWFYIFGALTFYAVKRYLRRKRQTLKRKRKTNRISSFLMLLFIGDAFMVCGKSILAMVFYSKTNSIELCVKVGEAHQAIHTISMVLFYLYLWLRQFTLYRNPYFRRVATIKLRRFSLSLLFLIFIFGMMAFTMLFFSVTGDDFGINADGRCYYREKFDINDLLVIVAYAIALTVHAFIVFLFVFVLKRHEKLLVNTNRTNLNSQWTGAEKLKMLVRTCFIAAAVSAVSNVLCVAFDLLLRKYITTLISNTFYDIDMLISFVCAMVCFTNYKKIFFPCKKTKLTPKCVTVKHVTFQKDTSSP